MAGFPPKAALPRVPESTLAGGGALAWLHSCTSSRSRRMRTTIMIRPTSLALHARERAWRLPQGESSAQVLWGKSAEPLNSALAWKGRAFPETRPALP